MISVNVLGHTVQDKDGLIAWLKAARPAYTLVMDDVALAQRAADTGTQVIFRRYRPDDHQLHETMSASAFLDSVGDLPASWIVQCLNEPGGDQRHLANWCAAVAHLAAARGQRLALPNWSTGNPDDELIAAGSYDLLLRALAGSQHLLAVHEYFHDRPHTEPWHIGRYRALLARADTLHIARPRVVVTEAGRDLGGGPNDGWRGQGWSEDGYADRLEEAQAAVYRPDGVTACVFGWGSGF